jgi:hypothetical protein
LKLGNRVKEVIGMKKGSLQLIGWIMVICCISGCQDKGILTLVASEDIGVAYGVCVDNHHAYVTHNDGVAVFDVHQPENPREVSKIRTGVTFGICVEDGLAYILGGRGLVIADVSDPANPKQIQEHIIGEYTQSLRLDGTHVYIASKKGLMILDAANPEAVTPIARFGDGWARSVDVSDGIAYVAGYENGVEVVDVKDPSSPKQIATVAGTKGAVSLHIHGQRLYVARFTAGIVILDISERESPQLIGSFCDDDGGEAKCVRGDGEHLYVQDGHAIEVLDVTDPTRPYEIGEDRRGAGHGICIDGKYIYLASVKKGLRVFRFDEDLQQ